MSKAKSFLIGLIGLTSSWAIIRFGSNSLFKILVICILFISLAGLNVKIRRACCNPWFYLMYGSMVITFLLSNSMTIGVEWVKQEDVQFFWMTVYVIFYLMASAFSDKQIEIYFRGFMYGSLIQMAWVIVQYMIYTVTGLDINMQLFSALYSRSYIKEGGFGASGLAWHPSNLAVLLVVLFWMFDNWYWKFIVLVTAILSNNSTVIICVVTCIAINLLINKKDKVRSVKTGKKAIVVAFIAIFVMLTVLIKTDLLSIAGSRISFIYHRLFGGYYDGGSTNAHIRYYTTIPNVIARYPLIKVLFGFGEGCSGYVMTSLFGQYSNSGAWALECDIVNILWNKGLVGFFLFYGWLLSIIKRGWAVNHKYAYTMLAIIVGGIFYNIQYDWVIVLEVIIDIAIYRRIDLFAMTPFPKRIIRNCSESA